jgi:hypothetical protein
VEPGSRGYDLVRGHSGTERRKPGTAVETPYIQISCTGRLPLIPRRHRLSLTGDRGVVRSVAFQTILVHPYLVIGVTGLRLPRRSLGYLRVPCSRTVPSDDEVEHPGRGGRPAPLLLVALMRRSGYRPGMSGCGIADPEGSRRCPGGTSVPNKVVP